MEETDAQFRAKYGPWALVAGASEGLGAEFAEQLAQKGLNIAIVARRRELLDKLALQFAKEHGVEVRPLCVDLANPDAVPTLLEQTKDIDLGLIVYNAALSEIGAFLDKDLDVKLRVLDLNCRTALIMAHEFGRVLMQRKRGGFLLVSSMSAFQGAPLIATYAASKAFQVILGESLWEEFARHGIDVLTCCAGPTRTPNYEASRPKNLGILSPTPMESHVVVSEALAKLGKTPTVMTGFGNKLAGLVMGRLLPRRVAIGIMARAMRSMYSK